MEEVDDRSRSVISQARRSLAGGSPRLAVWEGEPTSSRFDASVSHAQELSEFSMGALRRRPSLDAVQLMSECSLSSDVVG